MQILDTQIIVYASEDKYDGQIKQQLISSVTAKEFLLVQGLSRTKANYYIPSHGITRKYYQNNEMSVLKRDHPFSKKLTDKIIIEFGSDYPSIIEFSNYAITEAINSKNQNLFKESVHFLDKDMQKFILRRFQFLLNSEIQCIPINENILDCGLNLLTQFLLKYNTKAEVRNTINDMLILSTAINSQNVLVTKDSLLNRFASEYFDAAIHDNKDFVEIDFRSERGSKYSKSRESKEYINRGWKYRC
jgi:hypothetical protein